MPRKGRKRLAVDIPIYLHNKVKDTAKKRNITITMWILRAITRKLIEEDI